MKNIKIMLVILFCVTFHNANLFADVSVKVDTQKTGAPISKYIYGQFIEHLGNCFYGGLWAEMVSDRKFYYPITDDYNPWGI
ncbi:MAG: alpha-L-arabinofuranosidase C-terminal domain-containing protein, partial [Limisphaerales bacterium]